MNATDKPIANAECRVPENLGGNSLFRSEERIATEKRYLKRKWKAHIRLETYKSQDRVAMDAPRRQSVKL
jgi:hypothetical protein